MELGIMITVGILLGAIAIWLFILHRRAAAARAAVQQAKDDTSEALRTMRVDLTNAERGLDQAKSSLRQDELETVETLGSKARASLHAAETAFQNVLSAYRAQTQDPVDERLSQVACDALLERMTAEVAPKVETAETETGEYTFTARSHAVSVRQAGPLMASTALTLAEIARLSANAKIVRLRIVGADAASVADLEDSASKAKAALEERRFRTAYAILAPMQKELGRLTSSLTNALAAHARVAQERERVEREARNVRDRVSAASSALSKAVHAHPKASARVATLHKAAHEKALEAMLHASLARQSLHEAAAVDLRDVEERNRTAAAVLAVAATGAVTLEGYADKLVVAHKRQAAKAGIARPDTEEFVPDPEDILDILEAIGTFDTPAIDTAFSDAPSNGGGSHGGGHSDGNGGGHDASEGSSAGDAAGDGGCGGSCGGD